MTKEKKNDFERIDGGETRVRNRNKTEKGKK